MTDFDHLDCQGVRHCVDHPRWIIHRSSRSHDWVVISPRCTYLNSFPTFAIALAAMLAIINRQTKKEAA